jgi:peptidoglycan/LPS O-acetylase OafA/YrhL
MGAIRLFLAWVVAENHWQIHALEKRDLYLLTDMVKFGFNAGYAVLFFYVISGFLITYTLSHNYTPDLRGVRRFYKNRFIRIYSLYWPIVILTFLLYAPAWQRFVSANWADQVTGVFLIGADWRLAFASYPQSHFDALIKSLEQAWTLGAELTFYVLAPVLMRSWKIGAAILLVSFCVRGYFVWQLGTGLAEIWTYQFAVSTIGFFMLGHLACLAAAHWPRLTDRRLGTALLLVSVGVMTFATQRSFDTPRLWISILCFTVALPAVFRATKDNKWLNRLGELSYPVYLVHILVLIYLQEPILDSVPATWNKHIIVVLTSIMYLSAVTVAAFVVHHALEVPVSYLMRGLRWRSRPHTDATAVPERSLRLP